MALKQVQRLRNLQGPVQDASLEIHRGDSRAFGKRRATSERGAWRHSLHTPDTRSGEGVRGEQLVCGIETNLVTLPFGRGDLSVLNC